MTLVKISLHCILKAIRSVGREIYGGIITRNDAFEDETDQSNEPTEPKLLKKKEETVLTYENVERLFKGR